MVKRRFVLEVWGDLACFTRPELKVERFSYPVITPSSSRAIFESILWKPEFKWVIQKVKIINQPIFIALRRNEVKEKAPAERTINGWIKGNSKPEPIITDLSGEDFNGRTQRQTMALKNVKYQITASIKPYDQSDGIIEKYSSQFERRASSGQCFSQPYFGCREFPAYFKLVEEDNLIEPYKINIDIGLMLYDVFDLSKKSTSLEKPFISLFRAKVVDGVMEIPPFNSEVVIKPGELSC